MRDVYVALSNTVYTLQREYFDFGLIYHKGEKQSFTPPYTFPNFRTSFPTSAAPT